MIEDPYLPLFITEDIYNLQEVDQAPVKSKEPDESAGKEPENMVSEPETKFLEKPLHELAIWTPPLTNADRVLLEKILNAVNKKLSEAYLMEGIAAFDGRFKKLLCFGYHKEVEQKLKKEFPLYSCSKLEEQEVLVSVAPADLHESTDHKKKLWSALQNMFLV